MPGITDPCLMKVRLVIHAVKADIEHAHAHMPTGQHRSMGLMGLRCLPDTPDLHEFLLTCYSCMDVTVCVRVSDSLTLYMCVPSVTLTCVCSNGVS